MEKIRLSENETVIIQKEYLLRAVKVNKKGIKKVVKELRFNNHPDSMQIALFMDSTNCDFVSCIENYRFLEDSEYVEED